MNSLFANDSLSGVKEKYRKPMREEFRGFAKSLRKLRKHSTTYQEVSNLRWPWAQSRQAGCDRVQVVLPVERLQELSSRRHRVGGKHFAINSLSCTSCIHSGGTPPVTFVPVTFSSTIRI
jgi:hypothetical protein